MSTNKDVTGQDMKECVKDLSSAAADANKRWNDREAGFINRDSFLSVQLEKDGSDESAGSGQKDINVPLLSIVPLPNLQIDEVNVTFDMEVKENADGKSSEEAKDNFNRTSRPGMFKASGTISSRERCGDDSVKYHVSTKAVDQKMPEGLKKILDKMKTETEPEIKQPADSSKAEEKADLKSRTE